MANINVSYQDMETQAGQLRAGMNEIQGQLNKLKSQIDGLVSGGFVTDSASGAFHSQYESFTHGATQTIGALDGLATMLQTTANTLRDTDSQIAAQMGGA